MVWDVLEKVQRSDGNDKRWVLEVGSKRNLVRSQVSLVSDEGTML